MGRLDSHELGPDSGVILWHAHTLDLEISGENTFLYVDCVSSMFFTFFHHVIISFSGGYTLVFPVCTWAVAKSSRVHLELADLNFTKECKNVLSWTNS